METSASPLALPFEKALNVISFSRQLRVAADDQLRNRLIEINDHATRPAIATAQIVTSNRGISVVFKGGIPKGAKFLKDASGEAIPTLVDGKSATFLKNARVLGRSGKIAKAGAAAALAAVEVAHMISGHDNAKRLRKVDRAVETLVYAHQAELRARLEAIYRHSKGVLSDGIEELTEADRAMLHQQCRDLIELRSRWRYQFMHDLQRVDPADPGWFNKLFRWRKEEATRQSRVARAAEANMSMEIIRLMHFSLMLQTTLETAAGRPGQFETVTLPDEAESWRGLRRFAERRVREIGGGKTREFRTFLNAVDDFVSVWSTRQLQSASR